MSRTQMVLSRLLTKVDLNKPDIKGTGPHWALALHHVKSDKVWLMRSKSPLSIVERIKDVSKGLPSAVDKLPKALRALVQTGSKNEIDVYAGKSCILTGSYIWAELAVSKTLLSIVKNNGSVKYSVWMIVHNASGHYKLHKTSADNPMPNEVLRDFMGQLRRCNDEDNIIGARTRKFAEAYPQAANDMMQFTIRIVGRVNNLRKANVIVNEKIHDYGYAKCLNMTGVSKSAKLS